MNSSDLGHLPSGSSNHIAAVTRGASWFQDKVTSAESTHLRIDDIEALEMGGYPVKVYDFGDLGIQEVEEAVEATEFSGK